MASIAGVERESEYKPEQFYFFPNSWLDRTLKTRRAEKALDALDAWWGGDRGDWQVLLTEKGFTRAMMFADRFHDELGYNFVRPYPIYDRRSKRLMYYMIHATDHPRAPKLMDDAAMTVTDQGEDWLQLRLGS